MLETNELNQATMITIPKNKSSKQNSIARTISSRYFTISATFAMTKLNRNARTILPSYHYDNSYLCKSKTFQIKISHLKILFKSRFLILKIFQRPENKTSFND